MKKKTRALVISVIMIVTISGIVYGMATLFVDPYLSVDLVVANPDAYMGYQIQVKGKLQPGSLSMASDNITLIIYGETHTLFVKVETEVPNIQDDQEIVAIGVLESAGVFIASQLLAQCPSKYETNTTTSG